jgi:hypothetical protein
MLYAIKFTYGNNKITVAVDASIPSATTFPAAKYTVQGRRFVDPCFISWRAAWFIADSHPT